MSNNNQPIKESLIYLAEPIILASPIYKALLAQHAVTLTQTPRQHGHSQHINHQYNEYTLVFCADDITIRNAFQLYFRHVHPHVAVDQERINQIYNAFSTGLIILPDYFRQDADGHYPDIDINLRPDTINTSSSSLSMTEGSTTQEPMSESLEDQTDSEQSLSPTFRGYFLYDHLLTSPNHSPRVEIPQIKETDDHANGFTELNQTDSNHSMVSIDLNDDTDFNSDIHQWFDQLQSSDYTTKSLKPLPRHMSVDQEAQFCAIGSHYLAQTKSVGCLQDTLFSSEEPLLLGGSVSLAVIGLGVILWSPSMLVALTPALAYGAIFAAILNPWIWFKNEPAFLQSSPHKLSITVTYHMLLTALTLVTFHYALISTPLILAGLLTTPLLALGLRRTLDHQEIQMNQADAQKTLIERFNQIPAMASLFYIDESILEVKAVNPGIY